MQLSTAPWQVKLATALSLLAWIVKAGNDVVGIAAESEASADTTFAVMRIGLATATHAVTALLIFFALNRRNWARLGLLVWTVGAWTFWFFYRPSFDGYSLWAVRLSISLPVLEALGLLLFFAPKSAAWYSAARENAL
jgi:hypothetical protein